MKPSSVKPWTEEFHKQYDVRAPRKEYKPPKTQTRPQKNHVVLISKKIVIEGGM
jgi:hypothetical protein